MVAMEATKFLLVFLSVGSSAAFELVSQTQTVQSLTAGQELRLSCQADGYYEYCWWRHSQVGGDQRDCSLEWKYKQVTSPLSSPSLLPLSSLLSSLPHTCSY